MAAVAVLYLPCKHSVQAAEPFTSLKPPASHASHSAPSGPVYPLLQVQLVSCLLPTRENVCAGQSLHVDSEIWAVSVEYVPLEHSEHGAEPFTSLYVPAMHAAHAAPSGPVYPLLQVQWVCCLLPTPEYVCAGQSMHVDSEISAMAVLYWPCEHSEHGAEPFTSLYVPAMHAAHCIPSGPVYPLLQVQLVSIELPSGEYVCVGHSLHVASEIAASNVLYLP